MKRINVEGQLALAREAFREFCIEDQTTQRPRPPWAKQQLFLVVTDLMLAREAARKEWERRRDYWSPWSIIRKIL